MAGGKRMRRETKASDAGVVIGANYGVVFLFNRFESMCNLRGVLHIVVLLSKVNTWNRCRCRLASSPSKSKPLGFTRWVENTYSTMIFPL